MGKSRENRAVGILLAVLTAVMLMPALGWSNVSADTARDTYNAVMSVEEPDTYQDESFEPYGHGEDVPFYMNKQSELLFYQTNSQSSGDINTFYDKLKSASEDDVLGGTKTKALKAPPTKLKKAYFVQAVAFDPNGVSRDDHIAFIGVYGSTPHCYIWVYDTRSQKWTSEFDLGSDKDRDCRWMENTHVTDYEAIHFLSITAGDYDGDGRDTLVAYCAFNDVQGYYITELDCRNPDFKVQFHGSKFRGDALCHDKYDNVLSVDEHIQTKMACELDTGDINNDGLDDLVALTYIGNHDDKTIPLEKYRPMVRISLGEKGGSGIVQKRDHQMATWVWDEGWWWDSMVSPGMSVGDIDRDGYDEIVTAGISCPQKKKAEYTCERIHDDINENKMRVSIMGYTQTKDDAGHVKEKFVEKFNDELDTNAWTRSGFYEDEDYIWNKLGVECVAINGVGNAEQVFISGTLYRWENNGLTAAHTPELFKSSGDNLDSKASTNMFIQSTAAGNFDGNNKGYEQLAYVVSCKTQSKRSYDYMRGVVGGKKYNETTGIAREYYSTSKSKMNDDYAWPGRGKDNASGYISEAQGLNCIVVGADCDDDGVLARYKEKALLCADPEVLCVLQAPPYFEETKDYLTDTSETAYEISDIFSYEKSKSDSVSYGVGVVAGMESPAIQMEMTAGYALDWSKEFTEGHEDTVTLGWKAKEEDLVLVQRQPVVAYYYEIQSKDGEWSGEHMVVTVPCEPDLVTMGIDKYNAFAKFYNKTLTDSSYLKDFQEMTTLDFMKDTHKLDLLNNKWLGHEGDPSGYIKWTDTSFKTDSRYRILQKSPMRLGHNSESVSWGKTSGTSVGVTESMSHGFTYDATIAMGPNVGAASLYAGLTSSLQYMTGESTTTTQTKEQGISCEVNGLKVKDMPAGMRGDDYNFSFKMARWPSGIKHYVNGVAQDVPVYGYALSSVTKPMANISVEDQLKASEVTEAISELPTVEDITTEDEAAINQIREQYEALSDPAKTLVAVRELELLESRVGLLKNGGLDFAGAKVQLSKTVFTYNGKVQKPEIRTISGYTLQEGVDYTAVWSNQSSKNAGTYTVTLTGMGLCTGSVKATYQIGKAANTMTAKGKTVKLSYKKLKKKAQTIARSKAVTLSKAQGTQTYKLASVKKSKFKKYFKVNAKTGKITVKKKLKKGTYTLKIKVKCAGSGNYKPSAWKTVTVKVKVK